MGRFESFPLIHHRLVLFSVVHHAREGESQFVQAFRASSVSRQGIPWMRKFILVRIASSNKAQTICEHASCIKSESPQTLHKWTPLVRSVSDSQQANLILATGDEFTRELVGSSFFRSLAVHSRFSMNELDSYLSFPLDSRVIFIRENEFLVHWTCHARNARNLNESWRSSRSSAPQITRVFVHPTGATRRAYKTCRSTRFETSIRSFPIRTVQTSTRWLGWNTRRRLSTNMTTIQMAKQVAWSEELPPAVCAKNGFTITTFCSATEAWRASSTGFVRMRGNR